MTDHSLDQMRAGRWWTRPRVVFPILGAFVLLLALLTPDSTAGRLGDARLSAHLTGSRGARVLFEMAGRMGWQVIARDSTPSPRQSRSAKIHAVLAPPIPITPTEAHAYLDLVRGGDALLYAIGDRSPLADSLGVWRNSGGVLVVDDLDRSGCSDRVFVPPLWPDGRAHLYGVRFVTTVHGTPLEFALLHGESRGKATVIEQAASGFALGAGRVIVIADPDLLRNDVLRHCRWGADAVAVRMLEWLRAGGPVPRTAIEFDEFHQGYGPSHSPLVLVRHFLVRHPVGRTTLQIVLAALVLLLAMAPRPLSPHDWTRIERRDPLEQVGALAHAYQQVGATRTVTSRLLSGVRHRVEHGGTMARRRTDEAFLDDVEVRSPARAADVALVRRALHEAGRPQNLPGIGAALRGIEDTFMKTTE